MEDISLQIVRFNNKSKFKISQGMFSNFKSTLRKKKRLFWQCLESTYIKKNTNFTFLTLVSPGQTSTGYVYHFIHFIWHRLHCCDHSDSIQLLCCPVFVERSSVANARKLESLGHPETSLFLAKISTCYPVSRSYV